MTYRITTIGPLGWRYEYEIIADEPPEVGTWYQGNRIIEVRP